MATMAAAVARWSFPAHWQLLTRRRRLPFSASFSSTAPPAAAAGFGWADALRVAGDRGRGDEADLSGYLRKVDICNRGMVSIPFVLTCPLVFMSEHLILGCTNFWRIMQDKKGEFVEFIVDDQVVGYIHKG